MPSLLLLSLSLLNFCFCQNVVTIGDSKSLVEFAKDVNSGKSYEGTTIVLDADIDLSDVPSTRLSPIGTEEFNFIGEFDGHGHIISNLEINGSYAFAGLFGFLDNSTIKNIVLDESCTLSIYSSEEMSYTGGIIGYCASNISKCSIKDSVNMANIYLTGELLEAYVYIGGIAGVLSPKYDTSLIMNCINYGTITYYGTSSNAFIGGIIGHGQQTIIQNCANLGRIINSGSFAGESYFGGIIGFSYYAAEENCLSAGHIQVGKENIVSGTLIGLAGDGSSFGHCFWSENVLVKEAFGKNSSTVTAFNSSLTVLDLNTLCNLNQYSEGNFGKWVMLHLNGGRICGFENDETLIVVQKVFPKPVKEYHTFSYWCLDERCTKIYEPTSTSLDDVIELYAAWTVNNYFLTFDFDNGTTIEFIFKYEQIIDYPQDPIKSGYVFREWCTEDGKICSPVTMPCNNITLHPQWDKIVYSSVLSTSSLKSTSENSDQSSDDSSSSNNNNKKTIWEKIFTSGNLFIIVTAFLVFIIVVVLIIIIIVFVRRKHKRAGEIDTKRPLISEFSD